MIVAYGAVFYIQVILIQVQLFGQLLSTSVEAILGEAILSLCRVAV